MSGADFTRWNRAGLARFRYVDGNAVTHLEALRRELVKRLHDWDAVDDTAPEDETERERLERIAAQYGEPKREWAWEISRAFARALHIIAEHADAFANEGYLGTATQWDNVRRLAAMIGHTARPASSAETPLALLVRENVGVARVERGLQSRHTPTDGRAPVLFETLTDIDVAPVLNALRLDGWNRSVEEFPLATAVTPLADQKEPLWPVPEGVKLSAGDLAILSLGKGDPLPVRIAEIAEDRRTISIAEQLKVSADGIRGEATLEVAPAAILVPWLSGAGVVWLEGKHTLSKDDVVAWTERNGRTETTLFGEVIATGPKSLALRLAAGAMAEPPAGAAIYRAKSLTFAQFSANKNEWRLPLPSAMARSPLFRITHSDFAGGLAAGFALDETVSEDVTSGKEHGFTRLKPGVAAGAKTLWFADPGKDDAAGRVAAAPGGLVFDGAPSGLKSGDRVIVESKPSGARKSALSVAAIRRLTKLPDAFEVELEPRPAPEDRVVALHGPFQVSIRPAGHDFDSGTLTGSRLRLSLSGSAWPDLLAPGRKVILESASGAFAAVLATIVATDPNDGEISLDLTPADVAHIEAGDLVIRANVVTAGHGESKPVRVLGSGDASLTGQRFPVDLAGVSHVRDATLPGGVRAALSVTVEGQRYEQVASFRDAESADPVFVLRPTQEDKAELTFGDGRRGRRLPTGTNNVFASIRQGAGLSGNLPPYSLSELVREHPALSGVRQLLAAAGGDERERLEQIRVSAPARLRAMDRAISLADLKSLAEGVQGVWHAEALNEPATRGAREKARIVVVPAGGGALGALGEQVRAFLAAKSVPNLDITVAAYRPIALCAEILVRVDPSQFNLERVREDAHAAVLGAFELRRRRPGQPLFRSEAINAVERTTGVANALVRLFPSAVPGQEPDWLRAARGDDGEIWAVWPHDDQVISADNPALVAVVAKEAFI